MPAAAKPLVALGLLCLAAACSGAESGAESGERLGPFAVSCSPAGGPVAVTFLNDEPARAVLDLGTEELLLPRARSGSGARYAAEAAAGETVFWVKGDSARFERPEQPTRRCAIASD